MDNTSSGTVLPATAQLTVGGHSPGINVFHFCGLMWATEYNARYAQSDQGANAETVNAMNTLLMAYAALQALVLETAFVLYPSLYERKSFRRFGMVEQYQEFLAAEDRSGEETPSLIAEVSAHRIALTHSEPDNVRSRRVGGAISAMDASWIAQGVRDVAEWLWRARRPTPVASEFDTPNSFLPKHK